MDSLSQLALGASLGVAVMGRDFSLDISRARQYLVYGPQVPFWTALEEFCTWWKVQGR